jgi:hypothetical protein
LTPPKDNSLEFAQQFVDADKENLRMDNRLKEKTNDLDRSIPRIPPKSPRLSFPGNALRTLFDGLELPGCPTLPPLARRSVKHVSSNQGSL